MVEQRKKVKRKFEVTLTFNASIPQPNDIISQSQAQIQTNFSQTNTIFDVNHITFDNAAVASRGKHRRVDLTRVAAPGSIAAEAVLYQKLADGNSQIFMQRDANATEIQLTGQYPVVAATGSTFLPGGLLMNWGSVAGSASGNPAVFATPFTTALYSVTLGIFDTNVSRTATWEAAGLTQITIRSSAVNTVFYIAIGK